MKKNSNPETKPLRPSCEPKSKEELAQALFAGSRQEDPAREAEGCEVAEEATLPLGTPIIE